VDAGTKLTPDQLDALVPGDVVTIESGAEFESRIRTKPSGGRLVLA
jgi:hypothetical protein